MIESLEGYTHPFIFLESHNVLCFRVHSIHARPMLDVDNGSRFPHPRTSC